jgi:hypothetical protein
VFVEDNKLVYDKYLCIDCGEPVVAHTVEDVLKNDKKCADCRVIDITGGFKPKPIKKVSTKDVEKSYIKAMSLDADNPTNLRRDISKNKKGKHKKILSPKEKALARQREEEKWERIRAGWKSFELPNTNKSNSGE